MDWSYIAGYFDGEGHVGMHAGKRKNPTATLNWYNSHLGSLEKMLEHMGAGSIYSRQPRSHQNKIVYCLTVANKKDIVRIIDAMSPYLLIKREAALRLREHLVLNVKSMSPNFGKVAALSTEQISAWYFDGGLSLSQIAEKLGVAPSAVCVEMKRRGLVLRDAGGSHMRGVPKSPETRARMKASRQAMWKDPEFRANQLANLAKSRKAAAAQLTAGNA